MKTRVIRGAALLLAVVALCILSNIAAFLVDTPQMRESVWQGCLMLGEQYAQPQHVGGFLSSQLDNYTGVLILKTAGYIGDQSLLEKAFGGFRVDMRPQAGQTDWEAFCNYEFWQEGVDGSPIGYSRYWHGYTLALRLLLSVLDVANLQMLMYFVQMILMLAVLHLMDRRGLRDLIPGFFLAYFLMMPFSSGICLQYMPVSMLMLAACICILLADEQICRAVSLPVFFALLGVLTNYFDLLTFPMVSLGFPLVMAQALALRRGESAARLFAMTALCGISWALGYGLMWTLKWLLTACVFGSGALGSIIVQIGLRTSDNAGSISRLSVLMQNLNVLLAKKSYLLIIGITGLAALARPAKAILKGAGLRMDLRALNLLLPAAAVCLWYFVMANHSFDHTYFTYRNAAAMVFAGFAFVACALCPKRGEDA